MSRTFKLAMVAVLAAFFQYTSTGRALRAGGDDHQGAQSTGIPATAAAASWRNSSSTLS